LSPGLGGAAAALLVLPPETTAGETFSQSLSVSEAFKVKQSVETWCPLDDVLRSLVERAAAAERAAQNVARPDVRAPAGTPVQLSLFAG